MNGAVGEEMGGMTTWEIASGAYTTYYTYILMW